MTTPTFEINANPSNSYCFVTKAQVKDRIESGDTGFLVTCLLVLYRRQTEDEQATKDTKYKNKRGFMSSHAVHGTRIAEELAAGLSFEQLTEADQGRVQNMVPRYIKQLAGHFRAEQEMSMDSAKREEQRALFGV
jgi:hypothetical protein